MQPNEASEMRLHQPKKSLVCPKLPRKAPPGGQMTPSAPSSQIAVQTQPLAPRAGLMWASSWVTSVQSTRGSSEVTAATSVLTVQAFLAAL